MRIKKRLLAVAGLAVSTMMFSGVALAVTSTSFQSRAIAWTNESCTQALLRSRNDRSSNEDATICYNFLKANEQQVAINNQQLSINDLLARTSVPGPKGDKGDTGAQGIPGLKGDKGDTGDTGLQGLNAKSLKVYDGNNALLGAVMSINTNEYQFYNESIGRIVIFDSYGRVKTTEVSFSQPNCTGDAYYTTRDSSPIDPSMYLKLVKNTLNGNYYYITDQSQNSYYTALPSYRDENNVCVNSTSSGNVIKLNQVSLPFAEPIKMPLRTVYE